MKLPHALATLSLLIALSGCATIIHGTTQDIGVTTDPAGADLLLDGQQHYFSPATITMKRKHDHMLEISKEGYKTEMVDIRGDMSLAVVGDVLAGGAIGYGIDAATGAQRRLVPEKIALPLRPLLTREDREAAKTLAEKLAQLKIIHDEGKITRETYIKGRRQLLAAPGKD